MRSFRFRPRVEGLEDRLTPVSASDFMSAAGQTVAGMAFFQAVASDPGWMFNSAFRPLIQQRVTGIFQGAEAAVITFESVRQVWQAPIDQNPILAEQEGPFLFALAGLEGMAQADVMLAQRVAGWTGFNLVPVTLPPTAPKPTDKGMTNTMPDPNATNWVASGTAGLKTWDVVQGSGNPVAAGDSITVFYTGWLASNGTKFDSRRSPAAPATFSLTGLIQGWQQGIPGMKPGGIRRLFVPAALGYGAAGSPPNIPANADLVFEIKLISHHP